MSSSPLVLPAIAIGLIGFARLGPGQLRPVLAARAWGGPQPEAGHALRLRLSTFWVYGPQTRPASVAVQVRLVGDRRLLWEGMVDSVDGVELQIPGLGTGEPLPALVVALPDGTRLVQGTPRLPRRWRVQRPALGGWIESGGSSGLTLRAALEHGALAVPFESAVWLELSPAQAVELQVELQGARFLGKQLPTRMAAGQRLRLPLRPQEHSVSLRVVARGEGGSEARLLRALPTVPGALWVRRAGRRLEVRSPLPRERGYLSLVSRTERVWASVVELAPEEQGSARGFVDLPPDLALASPLWAVVASEPDRRSAGAVGWSLSARPPSLEATFNLPRNSPPPVTFTPREELVLDSVPSRGAAEQERARRVRARLGTVSVGLSALAAVRIVWPVPGRLPPETSPMGRYAAALLVVLGCCSLAWLVYALP